MLTEAIIASVIAGSSVCSDHFENPNRFNPTELSDYQQCVLAAHSDEQAGVLGSIFWTKVGDTEFVSMPVSTLRKAGSADAAKEIVIKKVIDTVLVDQLTADLKVERAEILRLEGVVTQKDETIRILREAGVTDGETITRIENERDTALGRLMTLAGNYESAETRVNDLVRAERQAVAEASGHLRTIRARDITITGLNSRISGLNANNNREVNRRNALLNELRDYADASHGTIRLDDNLRPVFDDNGFAIFDNVGANNAEFHRLQTGWVAGTVTSAAFATQIKDWIVAQVPATTFSSAADGNGNGVSNTEIDAYVSDHHDSTRHRFDSAGDGVAAIGTANVANNNGASRITMEGRTITIDNWNGRGNPGSWILSRTLGESLNSALTETINNAYTDGFNDGYSEGYHDGYHDGFKDGVDSVSAD